MLAKKAAIARARYRAASILTCIVAAAILIGTALHPTHAQQASLQPAPQGAALPPAPWQDVQVLATPYFWLPWISSTVHPADTRIPSSSSTVDPGTLITHLTWVPFMGAAEFRDGPFGLALDYLHVPVKTGVNTRGILFSGATGRVTEDVGTAMFLYRLMEQPDQYVDIGVGVRAWGVDGNIALNQGLLLPAVSVANGLSWADPLIGARYHRDFGNGYSATAYGDIGGFGLGAHIDWQAVATLDYALNSSVDLHGGFRSLNFSFGGSRADFHQHIYGPILSATFRF
jgi:hypothetical protein